MPGRKRFPPGSRFSATAILTSKANDAVIVIFASRYDQSAASLMARWAAHDASLLTCDDLSVSGWRHYLSSAEASTAVVGGRVCAVEEIEGVLIRWPGVFAQELTQITAADRSYVAGEMMSFLVSWFSSLRCPVVNRPSPVNLAGPAWRQEQWTHAAARLGIPVRPFHRRVSNNPDHQHQEDAPTANPATVTVVGQSCFGEVDEKLLKQAVQLAEAAGVSLLQVSFSGPEAGSFFTGADLLPALTDETADAALELILRGGAKFS